MEVEKKENENTNDSDGDSKAENNDETVEKIELIGDDKAALSDSMIIVEKDPEENGGEGFSPGSSKRRITRGFLNTELEDKSEDESEDDSPNVTPVPNKSDAENSGNENNSKLNDSFKVDLRPSWMMKKNFGERN